MKNLIEILSNRIPKCTYCIKLKKKGDEILIATNICDDKDCENYSNERYYCDDCSIEFHDHGTLRIEDTLN